jgi:polysaccharide biosynthesis protein PslH
MGRLSVLVLAWQVPFPPDQGGRIRSLHLLRALADAADVTVLAFDHEEDGAEADDGLRRLGFDVQVVPRPAWQPHWSSHFKSADPLLVQAYPTTAMSALAAQCLGRRRYDIVVAEGLLAAPAVERLSGHRLHYQAHNVESEVYRRSIGFSSRNVRRRAGAALDYWKFRRFERRSVRRFTSIMAVSARDAARLARWAPAAAMDVIPNGVDCDYFHPGAALPQAGVILFTGTLDYPPNRDAVLFFGLQVFPRVKRRVPSARWYVVGRGGNDLPEALRGEPDIIFTGYVGDVRPYLVGAEVVVAPLRAGGGTRLKVLEAMAAGRAVVSTTLGAEGLELRHGEEIMIANGAEALADAVSQLLEQPSRARGMAEQARRTVLARYDWRDIGRRYVDAMMRICEKAPHLPTEVALDHGGRLNSLTPGAAAEGKPA